MTASAGQVQDRVMKIVGEALDRDPGQISPSSSLIDDLGAESIDFLDIVFRIEQDFHIQVPGDEIWQGSLNLKDADPQAFQQGILALKARMPEIKWERFPEKFSRSDLPRLITVQTIIDYVKGRLTPEGAPP